MLKLEKIDNPEMNIKVHGQGCMDDCVEKNVWVGKTNGNTTGCVIYETAYTPRDTTWW